MVDLKHKEITDKIIGFAYTVHNSLGQGFLEKVYKNAMAVELEEAGLQCSVEVPLNVFYKGRKIGEYFADIVVEQKIIVELKAVRKIEKTHEVQLVNYLKATGLNVGLIINFGESVEFKRKVFG